MPFIRIGLLSNNNNDALPRRDIAHCCTNCESILVRFGTPKDKDKYKDTRFEDLTLHIVAPTVNPYWFILAHQKTLTKTEMPPILCNSIDKQIVCNCLFPQMGQKAVEVTKLCRVWYPEYPLGLIPRSLFRLVFPLQNCAECVMPVWNVRHPPAQCWKIALVSLQSAI